MLRLSNATLNDLPDHVLRPTYDRSSLAAGMVHIGLGNFHRAHQAWYLHRLLQIGLDHDWAIIGAGVRAFDEDQRRKLVAQDYLTTLIELDPEGTAVEVTGAMIDYVPIVEGNGPLIAAMALSQIRIISMTVTEGGYYLDPVTMGFDATHPDIIHDAANPERPRTAFGAIVAAAKRRRDSGAGPFTGLCCDNLQGNGAIMRQTIVSLAHLSDPELAAWIDAKCTFPNSMVDCIVPATGPSERALVQSLGIGDAAPVTHENFRQWVIEDSFCAGRPHWEEVGATMTDNVHDFETMKIRILNGGHQIVANAGEVLSVETIAGGMSHPQIRAFFDKVARNEIVPHVRSVPGMSPSGYVDLICRRFSNSKIVDTTRRVAFDGSSRHPGFLIPSIRDGLAKSFSVSGLALASAAWARMCHGVREDGTTILPNDPFWADLQAAARDAKSDPSVWLGLRQIYGSLADEPAFAEPFARWLKMIWEEGMATAIDAYLAE